MPNPDPSPSPAPVPDPSGNAGDPARHDAPIHDAPVHDASLHDVPLDQIVAWVDGELPPADAARVAALVASNPAARREADLLRRSGALVARLPRTAASAGFAERVLDAVRKDGGRANGEARAPVGPASTAPRPPAGRLLSLPRIRIAVAAAIVVAVVAGGLSMRESEEDALARDLLVLANLDALQSADADDLARIADDLDLLDEVADASELGG